MAGNFKVDARSSGLSDGALDRDSESDSEDEADDRSDDETGNNADEENDEKILEEAHARLKLTEEAEQDIRRLALEDLQFRAGEQWPHEVRRDRERDGRPCLVINRIPKFIQQVANDQRQNRPSIKVHPVDDNADVETARIIQGLVRHIEYNSSADVAYDTAFESAAISGFGYFRIVTDFADPASFDQEIFIKKIRNPFSVFMDPYAQEADRSDANFGFIVDDLSPDEYRTRYPDSKLARPGEWDAVGNQAPLWVKSDSARVAEYFYKVFKTVSLVQLSDGTVLEKSKVEAYALGLAAKNPGQPVEIQVVRERIAKVPAIRWCKLNGIEILEKTEWPGKFIPIIPVYGSELYVDGKLILEGIVRNAKDPQRMYNYCKTAETEAIALAPRAPFLIAEGTIEGYEQEWATANRRNHAYLTYKPTSIQGAAVPPPQRQAFEPAVQAITQASMMAADDMKATTGIFDPALGAQSAETSGVAIQRRNTQTQTSNFHFIDNLTRSLKHAGRILVDLIPHIYDTARSARILGDDGTQEIVKLNQAYVDPDTGKPVLYQLDTGRYDVTVDVGPSFESKRQEAVAAILEVTRAYPPLAQVAGDLLVKNMDWPGSAEIAERLKKMLPPQLQDDGKGQNNIPPQVQAQMQQMQTMIQQLTERLHQSSQIIETKKLDLEHRERVEIMKLQVEAEIEMAKLGSKESIELLNHQVNEITQRLHLLDMNTPIGADPSLYAPEPAGGPTAQGGPQGAQPPTGGASPGSPMEGHFQ